MANILVRKNKKFRMWNTTVDAWVSPLMDAPTTMEYLLENRDADTVSEAYKRVHRIGYTKQNLQWLKKYFDSQYDRLSRMHRKFHGPYKNGGVS